jgi:hypothetical protein
MQVDVLTRPANLSWTERAARTRYDAPVVHVNAYHQENDRHSEFSLRATNRSDTHNIRSAQPVERQALRIFIPTVFVSASPQD